MIVKLLCTSLKEIFVKEVWDAENVFLVKHTHRETNEGNS